METDSKENSFYFLNINKPKGMTSFDVIFKLRKLLKIKKIGHSGTLDPMAEGVMQVAVGNASRLLEYLDSDKEYIARIKFGYNSTTLDSEGEITKTSNPDFDKSELENTIKEFEGEITQIPPKFSAIKINGQKLCDIARKNPEKEIEIPERKVQIHKIELLNFSKTNNDISAEIRVSCSKGTYIRTLAQDIAKKLNTDAYLTKLTRIRAGNFKIEDSINIEDALSESSRIRPSDALNLEEYKLSEKEFNLVKNGVMIRPDRLLQGSVYMLTYNGALVSIGVLSDNIIKVKKFFGCLN